MFDNLVAGIVYDTGGLSIKVKCVVHSLWIGA